LKTRTPADLALEQFQARARRIAASTPRDAIYLHPGQLAFPSAPSTITTILGSCVAVCLWNVRRRRGGMNHFLLPEVVMNGHSSPRFGNVAVRMLIDAALFAGDSVADLEARVFGGACVLDAFRSSSQHLGEKNARAAKDFLHQRGVRIVAEDTGGTYGRKLIYHTDTGDVTVTTVGATAERRR
jgi:chemotaxis protein CheD